MRLRHVWGTRTDTRGLEVWQDGFGGGFAVFGGAGGWFYVVVPGEGFDERGHGFAADAAEGWRVVKTSSWKEASGYGCSLLADG